MTPEDEHIYGVARESAREFLNLVVEAIARDAHSTREIVADAAGARVFGHNPAWIKLSSLIAAMDSLKTALPKIHASIVTDRPGSPVAAPCAIDGCQYAALEARTK